MRAIYEYLDYRDYLSDYFTTKKSFSSSYTYRTLANELDMDISNAFRVLHGQGHLPARSILRALEILDLSGKAAVFFLILITCSRERNQNARKEILEKAKVNRFNAGTKSGTGMRPSIGKKPSRK